MGLNITFKRQNWKIGSEDVCEEILRAGLLVNPWYKANSLCLNLIKEITENSLDNKVNKIYYNSQSVFQSPS